MDEQIILRLDEVSLRYSGSDFQLGPISFCLNRGECVGLMGENGAGKSTLFQLITGNLRADTGIIEVNGQRMAIDQYQLKRHVGYLPQNLEVPKWVSGQDLLSYGIKLYGLDDNRQLLAETMKFWDCSSYAHKPLAACSHGMQKRVALGLATLHQPDLLILDEPFAGLDLFHIKALQDIILRRQSEGKATILCTHIAPYTAKLCHRLISLRAGQMKPIDGWGNQDYVQRIETIENLFYQ